MEALIAPLGDLDSAADLLAEHGVCWTPPLLSTEELEEIRKVAAARFVELLRAVVVKAVSAASSGDPLEAVSYGEIVERDGGRFDCRQHDIHASPPLSRAVRFMSQLARRALGDDAVLLGCGQVVAMSVEGWVGASDLADDGTSMGAQNWHMDGTHVFGDAASPTLPAHALTFFVPLVDLTAENGPTEFAVDSHRRWLADGPEDNAATAASSVALLAPAGSAICFDYRTWHRGLPNRAPRDRHMLYFVAARPWFHDRNLCQRVSIFGGVGPLPPRLPIIDLCEHAEERVEAHAEDARTRIMRRAEACCAGEDAQPTQEIAQETQLKERRQQPQRQARRPGGDGALPKRLKRGS